MTQTYKNDTEPEAECSTDLKTLLAPELFKALGDSTRLKLLNRLSQNGKPSTVTEAAGCCAVDLSVVSRHLATLRRAGILESEKRGREVYYSVPHSAIASTLRAIADALEACCPPEETEASNNRS